MKTIIVILCTALLTACVFADTEGQCTLNGRTLTAGTHSLNCIQYKCDPPTLTAKACALYRCKEGEEIGYKEIDVNKPYPECCGGPICKENQ